MTDSKGAICGSKVWLQVPIAREVKDAFKNFCKAIGTTQGLLVELLMRKMLEKYGVYVAANDDMELK